MSVGTSNGSRFNHRHVALVSPCPNCHGWMIWLGLRILLLMIEIGFSSAIIGIGAASS